MNTESEGRSSISAKEALAILDALQPYDRIRPKSGIDSISVRQLDILDESKGKTLKERLVRTDCCRRYPNSPDYPGYLVNIGQIGPSYLIDRNKLHELFHKLKNKEIAGPTNSESEDTLPQNRWSGQLNSNGYVGASGERSTWRNLTKPAGTNDVPSSREKG